jgi:hypothetical protein
MTGVQMHVASTTLAAAQHQKQELTVTAWLTYVAQAHTERH